MFTREPIHLFMHFFSPLLIPISDYKIWIIKNASEPVTDFIISLSQNYTEKNGLLDRAFATKKDRVAVLSFDCGNVCIAEFFFP